MHPYAPAEGRACRCTDQWAGLYSGTGGRPRESVGRYGADRTTEASERETERHVFG